MLTYTPSLPFEHQQINLWHARLGHPSISRMKLMNKHDPDVSFLLILVRTAYPLAKQHRLPFL